LIVRDAFDLQQQVGAMSRVVEKRDRRRGEEKGRTKGKDESFEI
jgi:hypothetical protein